MRLIISGGDANVKEFSAPDGIIRLEAFCLRQEWDSLSECRARFLTTRDAARRLLDTPDGAFSVECEGHDVFAGLVREVSSRRFRTFSDLRTVELRAVPAVWKLDRVPRYRIFQNERKTLSDLFDLIRQKTPENFTAQYQNGANHSDIPEPVLQHGETDWAFLRRMARRCGFHVFVSERKAELTIGEANGKPLQWMDDEKAESVRHTHTLTDSGALLERVELITPASRDAKPLSLGTPVRLRQDDAGKSYCVAASQLRWEKTRCVFRYALEFASPVRTADTQKTAVDDGVYAILEAEVFDNADTGATGKIQVRFTDSLYEDLTPDKKMWIPYCSPYTAKTGGFVFLPDKGDPVRVFFFRDSLSAGESPRRDALEEPFRNVDEKRIANVHEKRISFTEKELELYANGNTLSMTEDGLALAAGKSEINVTKDGITLKLNGSQLSLQNGSAQIKSNQVELSGNDIILK